MNRLLLTIFLGFVILIPLSSQSASAGGAGDIGGKVFDDSDGDGLNNDGGGGFATIVCLDNGLEGFGFEEFASIDLIQPAYAGVSSDQCVFTDGFGNYQFFGVPFGPHTVYAVLVSGAVATTPLIQEVIFSDVSISNVNFGMQTPPPPPGGVVIAPSSNDYNGLPVVYWEDPNIMISKNIAGVCGGDSPLSMTVTLGPFSEPGDETFRTVTMNPTADPNIWKANVADAAAGGLLSPNHGTTPINFDIICPSGLVEMSGGSIYIDPSGLVTTCGGQPIVGAEVLLSRFDPNAFFPFGAYVPADDFPFIVHDQSSDTLFTDAIGHYGWNVLPGNYRVDVDATGQGFGSAFLENLIIVTDPILDADFFFEPAGGCGNVIGGTLLPVDSTALFLVGAQSSALWILPVVIAGAGFAAFKLRKHD